MEAYQRCIDKTTQRCARIWVERPRMLHSAQSCLSCIQMHFHRNHSNKPYSLKHVNYQTMQNEKLTINLPFFEDKKEVNNKLLLLFI